MSGPHYPGFDTLSLHAGAAIDPAYGILAGHLVFLVVLATRPRGLVPAAVTR